ncbi:hypothetical protein GCM10023195_80260 [Actinoallomurus liliacearum]|uniref:Uncharacterized protein n=1 Tax=Actinoallomurus liliacearum TaxID=1080073 RepID=A0ABP8TZS3_9ACTN
MDGCGRRIARRHQSHSAVTNSATETLADAGPPRAFRGMCGASSDFGEREPVKAPPVRVRYFFKETPPPEGRHTDPLNLYTTQRSSSKEPRVESASRAHTTPYRRSPASPRPGTMKPFSFR